MSNLTKITVAASVASVLAYYANSIYKQYGDYVSGEGIEDTDVPGQFRGQASANRRKPTQGGKKPSGNERLAKELNDLYVNGQLALEEENYSLAISTFERMLEFCEDNPAMQQGTPQALSSLFKIATQLNNAELTIKYAKKIIEYFGKPTTADQLKEIMKFHEILVDRLVSIGKIQEAVTTIKNAIKKYKLNDFYLAEQYSVLATIYQSNSSFTSNEEQLDTIQKSIACAKRCGDQKLQINAIFDLYYYYARENQMAELRETQEEIEKILPQLSAGYFRSSSDILLRFERFEEFIKQRSRFISFIRENPTEMPLEKISLENLLNGFNYEIACAHMELGESEKALEIIKELKASEYLSYSPNTKSKYFQVTKVSNKIPAIKVTLSTRKFSEFTQEQKDTGILVCSFNLDQEDKPEPIVQEQPITETIKFKFNSDDFNPKSPYLLKFEYYTNNKAELVSTFYQLIAPQEPQHPLSAMTK